MKRCPQCGREYDNTMSFCLDDGSELLYGPASMDEPQTAILPERSGGSDADTAILPPPATADDSGSRSFDKRLLMAPLVVAAIILAGFVVYRNAMQPTRISSIAVMPFLNESGNADLEYLSDGMTETLISSLTQIPDLTVKSRSTVFRYKGKEIEAPQLGKELGVQSILTGRLVQRADQLTLSLELIDGATENAVWSKRYERKPSDLLALQNEIAHDVSRSLRSKLSGADSAAVEKNYTANSEAYRLYLQGRFYWNKRELKEFQKAIEFFDQAVAIDPNFALAYAGLADVHVLLYAFDVGSLDDVFKARDLANKALSLDPEFAPPRATLGLTSQYQYDWAGAEREYKRAIELDPDYATAHQWYGEMLVAVGRTDEGLKEHLRSIELDPLSLPVNWTYGRELYFARRFEEAEAQLRKTIEIDPNFARAHRTMAEVLRAKKDYPNSVEERAKFHELSGNPEGAKLIREAFSKDGWTGYLRLIASGNPALRENRFARAKSFVDLGDEDAAFRELEKTYESRMGSVMFLTGDPGLDPLRGQPRFRELLKKIGLTQ
jgi:TolB-like protein/lipoprotein NlpI